MCPLIPYPGFCANQVEPFGKGRFVQKNPDLNGYVHSRIATGYFQTSAVAGLQLQIFIQTLHV